MRTPAAARPLPTARSRATARLFERAGFSQPRPVAARRRDRADRVQRSTRSGSRPREDVPGNPYYYVVRQSIYAVIGIALMFARGANRLLALPRAAGRHLHGDDRRDHAGPVLGEATRGSRRWIELPFFTFQPSELGKVLLVVTLAAFAIDRARRGARSSPDARACSRSGCSRRRSSSSNRTSARRSSTASSRSRCCSSPGCRGATSRPSSGGARRSSRLVLVIAPAVGVPILADYQQERLTAFLHPSDDPATPAIRSIRR